ncbi:MAG: hypothetical protein RIQ81_2423 [Pseudomonadota bacterium]
MTGQQANNSGQRFAHTTVLLKESVDALALAPGDYAIDCTLGGGGHTRLMLEAVGKNGKVFAFDRDSRAIENARFTLTTEIANGQLVLVHAAFSTMPEWIRTNGLAGKIAGILADLGVSSPQIDEAERGFSFVKDGPLDMRMDTRTATSAADLVNNMDEKELGKLFLEFGEEPKARHFAKMICRQRQAKPFLTTLQLADFIDAHSPYHGPSRKHPATRIFQALRIAVNDEMGELVRFLNGSLPVLRPQGHLAIITFHSLEDRAVKRFFLDASGKTKKQSLARHVALPESELDKMVESMGAVVPPFPQEPSAEEIVANPRSRSARLRAFRKSG